MNYFVRIRSRLGFAATTLVLASALSSQAQRTNEPTAEPPANITTSHQILVRGCLKRGNEAGTYVISDQNGTTWELVSGSSGVDLSKHIFHSVSIAGKEVPVPAGHELRVLSLQVLSRSCTR